MVSFIQKLGHHMSLGKWLLCSTGLIRYLYPTDDELRNLAGIQKINKNTKKSRHGRENEKPTNVFHVPKSLDIALKKSKVVPLDIVHLRFYHEYQWLIDFSVYAAVMYILTETYQLVFKIKDEVNLSMLWCFLVIGFAMKVLLSLTKQYFQGEESGERSTVIVTGFGYFLLAMIILIIDENNLELGLETAYQIFNKNAVTFLQKQGINSSGPASKIVLKFFLAIWCGLIGALFTFPGLRMARMHKDALEYCSGKRFLKLLLNINFAMPFLITTLWVKPISRDYLTNRVFNGMTKPIMSSPTFESVRLLLVLFGVILHFCFMPFYLQCYLNMANTRVEGIKKEAGRITNTDLQKRIAAIFYYLCVVALQYSAPILICLFLTFMYKTLGGFTWTGEFLEFTNECPLNPAKGAQHKMVPEENYTIKECAHQFTLALESLKGVIAMDTRN
ncbi:hypothetical protein RUM44_005136 [Polyplax serrata]|uniref:Transmembrane protein 161B n=1 Tax=Polyplax serrata TaxID=468196 RepID=A0ABR1AFH6_POLSC